MKDLLCRAPPLFHLLVLGNEVKWPVSKRPFLALPSRFSKDHNSIGAQGNFWREGLMNRRAGTGIRSGLEASLPLSVRSLISPAS